MNTLVASTSNWKLSYMVSDGKRHPAERGVTHNWARHAVPLPHVEVVTGLRPTLTLNEKSQEVCHL